MTCPYRGRRKHAAHTYITQPKTALYLSMAERIVEYNHLRQGCTDICKGPHSQVARRNRALLLETVEAINCVNAPPYIPRTPTPDYVPADNEAADEV